VLATDPDAVIVGQLSPEDMATLFPNGVPS
jgi:hypothetical protein